MCIYKYGFLINNKLTNKQINTNKCTNKTLQSKKCLLIETPVQADAFLRDMAATLLDYIRESNDRKSLVVDFHHPTELRQLLGHLLPVGQDHVNLEEILRDCRETLKYCVRTGPPVCYHYYHLKTLLKFMLFLCINIIIFIPYTKTFPDAVIYTFTFT